MDSSQKEEGCCSSEGLGSGETIKWCSDCKTTKTPLWRSGPSGPKSLCNACGIRYRKKRPTPVVAATATTMSSRKDEMKKGRMGKTRSLRDALEVNIIMPALEGGQISPVKGMRSPRQWGEVERAALLLMALSCGAVFA